MGRAKDSRRVSAKEALELIKGPLPNVELMKQLRISTKGLADLLTQLLVKGLITEDDLERRGVRHKFQKKSSPTKTKSPKGKQSVRTASEVVMDISVGTGTMTVTAIETPLSNQQKAVLIDSSVITEVVTLQPLEAPPVAAEQVHQYVRPLDHQDDVFLDTTALTDLLSANIPTAPSSSPAPPTVKREKERVTIRFMPGTDHFVSSRLLHPAQKIMRQSDGSFLTTVDVSIDRHLVTWILSFGAMAEVLEPEKLRVTIQEELMLAAGRYEPKEKTGAARNRGPRASEDAKMTGLIDFWEIDKK